MVKQRSGDAIKAYDDQAVHLAAQYEAVPAGTVNASFADLIPKEPGATCLDVGAGSGRDAAWFASFGHEVVAVEPAARMRAKAQQYHADASIRWLDDRLPGLERVVRLGLAFDFILLSAVWMHVAPTDRPRAFRKLVSLLKPSGLLVITLRHGPAPANRPMWEVTAPQVEALARDHGLVVHRISHSPDAHGRPEISWTTFCLCLPDDGSGGLPLLRSIILKDAKSATYKLGLLRAIAKVADTTPGLARLRSDDSDIVEVPLGAVAMNWLRMYLPLVSRRFPQAPRNAGPDRLGFAGPGFRALQAMHIKGQDLRIGAQFSGDRATGVARALREARTTIALMPSRFITYPNSDRRIFEVVRNRTPSVRSHLRLDQELLSAYGTLTVPGNLWRALQRLGPWVEPVIVSEWARLMHDYAGAAGRRLPKDELHEALAWLEPSRDTAMARAVAAQLQQSGRPIRCIWSGRPLNEATTDIDHCLPWAAWPCGDLWNLFPASRRINQHEKRNKLPSGAALATARKAILSWWNDAWLPDPMLGVRFVEEARAALPVEDDPQPDEIFSGLEWRRLRLWQDQQLEEWSGTVG